MAITSEIIGKLGGGAGVEVVPVDVTATGNSGSEEVFYTVEVPDGETWLVAVQGNLFTPSTGPRSPQLVIGSSSIPPRAENGQTALIHVGTGTINASLRRNNSTGHDSFTGTLYAVKM